MFNSKIPSISFANIKRTLQLSSSQNLVIASPIKVSYPSNLDISFKFPMALTKLNLTASQLSFINILNNSTKSFLFKYFAIFDKFEDNSIFINFP